MGELGLIGTIVWFLLLYHLLKNFKTSKKILKSQGKKELPLLITGMQIALFVRLFEGVGSTASIFSSGMSWPLFQSFRSS